LPNKSLELKFHVPYVVLFCFSYFGNYGPLKPDNNVESHCTRTLKETRRILLFVNGCIEFLNWLQTLPTVSRPTIIIHNSPTIRNSTFHKTANFYSVIFASQGTKREWPLKYEITNRTLKIELTYSFLVSQ
jgi:hypothetical protein